MKTHTTVALGALLLFGCAPQSEPQAIPVTPVEPAVDPVAARVAESTQRLATTDGGKLVSRAIEAHGGLAGWLGAGTIAFDFDYSPRGDASKRRNTRNRVDLWSARAVQTELGDGADATLGWNGEVAWITPSADAFPSSARFWALTPYYFVGMPFVLADPGTHFEVLPNAEYEGAAHHLVKVTYADGTGDSPDDYYIVYLHSETGRLSALRYVVAYPAFFKDGGHTPEKLMKYEGQRKSGGLWLASTLHTFAWDPDSGIGEQVTDITVGPVTLGEVIPASDFDPPTGAVVSEDL